MSFSVENRLQGNKGKAGRRSVNTGSGAAAGPGVPGDLMEGRVLGVFLGWMKERWETRKTPRVWENESMEPPLPWEEQVGG